MSEARVPNRVAELFEGAEDIFSNVRSVVQSARSVYDMFAGSDIQVPPGVLSEAQGVPAPEESYTDRGFLNAKTALLIGAGALVLYLIMRG